jgi:GNAT superfamily N-acetyltransferase
VSLLIRPARPEDAALVFDFIQELADYERMASEVRATPEEIAAALFAPAPRVFCSLAEWQGEAAGFALWFYNFSTFRGRHGIYLEDLFVRPQLRGRGIGKALLGELATRAVREGCARLEWSVLAWNSPSIAFYEGLGAKRQDGWHVYRLSDAALLKLAGKGTRL